MMTTLILCFSVLPSVKKVGEKPEDIEKACTNGIHELAKILI
jgi:hypothetical protein